MIDSIFQFEGMQAETLDRGGSDPYSLPGELFWLGDQGIGWDEKQKGESCWARIISGPEPQGL